MALAFARHAGDADQSFRWLLQRGGVVCAGQVVVDAIFRSVGKQLGIRPTRDLRARHPDRRTCRPLSFTVDDKTLGTIRATRTNIGIDRSKARIQHTAGLRRDKSTIFTKRRPRLGGILNEYHRAPDLRLWHFGKRMDSLRGQAELSRVSTLSEVDSYGARLLT
jgi:hypothetical protein